MSSARKNASVLWAHFDKDNTNKTAQCHLCKDTLSYKSTTANLRIHLKRKHVGTFTSLMEEEHQQIRSEGEPAPLTQNLPSTSNAPITVLPPPPPPTSQGSKKQKVLDTYVNKKITADQKKRIDLDLLDLCVDGLHPFSLVEERSFKKFCHWIPGYKLPTRKTLSNSLLDETYHRVDQQIKSQVFGEVQSICLTTDLWTSRTTECYIAVTGHYLTESLEFKTVLLRCCNFSGNHTAVNIASELNAIMDQWGIASKVNFVVSDNASNIVKGIKEILKLKHFGCFAHTLNLIVDDAIRPCKELIDKVKRVVAHYRKSTVSAERLTKYQLQQNADAQTKRLVQDVDSRWNSTFYMVSRFVELKEALRSTMALVDRDLPQITVEDWSVLTQLITVLHPFEQLTKDMSGEKYLTASSVIVMTRCLKEALNVTMEKIDQEVVIDVAVLLKHGIADRLKSVEQSGTLSLCTFMDPRFKTQAFADQNEAIKTKDRVKNLVAEIIGKENPIETILEQNNVPQPHDDVNPWSIFDRLLGQPTGQGTPLSRAIKEVDMYLSDERLPRKNSAGHWNCPLEWWRNHRAVYPHMAKLYIRQCNIVATSVPCERMFSKSGLIINQRRTRLTTKKVEKIMFLNVNMPEERFTGYM